MVVLSSKATNWLAVAPPTLIAVNPPAKKGRLGRVEVLKVSDQAP